jgi:hypothetical protein
MNTPFVNGNHPTRPSETNEIISSSSTPSDQHVQFGSISMSEVSPNPLFIEQGSKNKFQIDHKGNFIPHLVFNKTLSHEKVKEISENYCESLTQIEKEKNTQINSIKSTLHHKQFNALRKGYSVAVNADWERQVETQIKEIEKIAAEKRCVTTAQLIHDFLPYQKKACFTFLDQRSQQIENTPTVREDPADQNGKIKKIETSIEKIFTIKESLFSKSHTEIENLEKEELQATLEISTLADALCISLLNEDTDSYIEQAQSQLKEVDKRINLTASWSQENKFSISKWVPEFKKNLAEHQAELRLAVTLSPETAASVAQEIVGNIEKEVGRIRAAINECDSLSKFAKPEDQTALQLNALGLQQLLSAAKSAEAIYSRMAEEYEVKLKNSPQLRAELLKLSSSIARDDSAETPQKTLLASLLSSLPLAQVTESSKKSNEFSHLSQLGMLPEEQHGFFIIGTQEKIKVTPPTESISDLDRTSFTQGIHLTQLALFRNFGIEAVERFKTQFHDAIEAANPITLKKLQDFVESENKTNNNSFYLSTKHGWSELQSQWDDPSNDNRVIRSEGISFNPFSKKLESSTRTLNQEQLIQEGIQVTRKVLEDHWEAIAPKEKNVMLDRFNQKFVKNKMPLTLGSLKSFLKESEPQGYFNLSRAVINNLKWNLLKASVSAVQNTAWFLGSGPLPAFFLDFTMEFYGDLTAGERMMEH